MADAHGRRGPWLLLVIVGLVIAALVAFVALRANGGSPGEKPATRTLPQGAPSGK